jgi:O-antigen ligase/polysaccharide polymerase Wzy-like membrane protein
MGEQNGMKNGGRPTSLAERLGTGPDQAHPSSSEREHEHSLWVPDDLGQTEIQPDPRLNEHLSSPAAPGPLASLREGLTTAEAAARRIADDIARMQSELRSARAAALTEAPRVGRPRPRLASPRVRTILAAALLLVVAAGLSWRTGLLSTGSGENLVVDSGFESSPLRWQPAGLHGSVSAQRSVGVGGSAALEVRTRGSGDGEGAAYYQADGVQSGGLETFSAFARSIDGTAVYPEIRWRGSDGALIQASRGPVQAIGDSWTRIAVSGTTPDDAISALLVVGEAAGTPKPVSFLVDDAQLEHASAPGPYVQTGDQTGNRPGHLTDVAAVLMLLAAALLAFTFLTSAVLVALPLSLAIPPSFASFDSHLPDMTPTRALVVACMLAVVVRRELRAPPRLLVALAAAYSAVVLVALVGDPSVVTVRIAVSLTVGAFAPALLVLAVARGRRDLWALVGSLTTTAAAVAAVALVEWHVDRHLIPLYPGVIFDALERGDHIRARATFPHPIVLGAFLAMMLPLGVSLLLVLRGVRRVAAGAAAIVMAGGLAVALSRAPWLGAVVGLATFAGLSGYWRRWKPILAVVAVLGALVASPLGTPVRGAALGLVRPETSQERFTLQVRVDLARRIGAEGIRKPVSSSLNPADRPAFPAVIQGRQVDLGQSIDNTYVREVAQTGLVGLLALVALLVAILVETTRCALRQAGTMRYLGSGLAAAQFVVLLIAFTVGTISFSQLGTAFWLVAGAGIAMRYVDERDSDPR